MDVEDLGKLRQLCALIHLRNLPNKRPFLLKLQNRSNHVVEILFLRSIHVVRESQKCTNDHLDVSFELVDETGIHCQYLKEIIEEVFFFLNSPLIYEL